MRTNSLKTVCFHVVFLGAISIVQGQIYTQSSGTVTKTGETYNTTTEDESVVKITGGILNLDTCSITKSGGASNMDNSNFQGLNAAVLNYGSSGVINMAGGTITTSGEGANAFYAYEGSSTISKATISCTENSSRGIFAVGGGTITADSVTATTAGANSSVIATDRGGGTIYVTGGTYNCTGRDAAVIYSTGTIDVTGITGSSEQGEIAVIEGSNSVIISGESNITAGSSERGIMALQSGSGDAQGSNANFTITGGTLTTTDENAPLIEVVTNATGNIYLNSVTTNIKSGILMLVDYNTRWETHAATGNLYLNGEGYNYTGDIDADSYSTANTSILTGATLVGSINNANSSLLTTLTMDSVSYWSLTADSHINGLITNPCISGTTVSNIAGNGNNVYYTPSTNPNLDNGTFSLVSGGYLLPEGSSSVSDIEDNRLYFEIIPNPFTDFLKASVDLKDLSDVRFILTDLSGKTVYHNFVVGQPSGINEFTFNISDNIPTGEYVVQVYIIGSKETYRVTKLLFKY